MVYCVLFSPTVSDVCTQELALTCPITNARNNRYRAVMSTAAMPVRTPTASSMASVATAAADSDATDGPGGEGEAVVPRSFVAK